MFVGRDFLESCCRCEATADQQRLRQFHQEKDEQGISVDRDNNNLNMEIYTNTKILKNNKGL